MSKNKKGYWVTLCHVTDSLGYGEYIKLAGPAIEKFGGKFLARGGRHESIEGTSYERIVIIVFKSLDIAKKCYNSEEYKKALSFLNNKNSERLIHFVEGND